MFHCLFLQGVLTGSFNWEKILLSIDETNLDDDTFTQLFIDYCSLGGKDLDEI